MNKAGTQIIKKSLTIKMADGLNLNISHFKPKQVSLINQNPLFVLNGGPGSSNLNETMIPPKLFANREIVLMGYRGIDSKPKLSDKNLQRAIKAHSADLSVDDLKAIAKAYEDDVAFSISQGINISNFTIFKVIDDLEAVRIFLGFGTIDLYGISYGTRLAYLYGIKYGKNVGRVVMMGGNPPGHFYVDPREVDDVLEKYNKVWPSSEVKIGVNQKHTNWLWWKIDRGTIRIAAQALLFNPGTAAVVLESLIKSARSDNSGLAGLSFISGLFYGSINFLEFFLKGLVDYDPNYDAISSTEPRDFEIGSPLTRLSFGAAKFINSEALPSFEKSDLALMGAKLDTPCLVLNGNLDSSTPITGVRGDLMPLLPKGHLIELRGFGHVDFISRDPEQATKFIDGFLNGIEYEGVNKTEELEVKMDAKFSASMVSVLATAGVGILATGLVTTVILLLTQSYL